jgi:hypothetical protein
MVVRLSALRTGRRLRPGNIPGTHIFFSRGRIKPMTILRPERFDQWKIPITPSGTEPATIRFLAQCLNQLYHRVPPLTLSQLMFHICGVSKIQHIPSLPSEPLAAVWTWKGHDSVYKWGTEGGFRGVQPPPPWNSEVLPKLSRIPSSVEYTSVTT